VAAVFAQILPIEGAEQIAEPPKADEENAQGPLIVEPLLCGPRTASSSVLEGARNTGAAGRDAGEFTLLPPHRLPVDKPQVLRRLTVMVRIMEELLEDLDRPFETDHPRSSRVFGGFVGVAVLDLYPAQTGQHSRVREWRSFCDPSGRGSRSYSMGSSCGSDQSSTDEGAAGNYFLFRPDQGRPADE